MAPKGLFTTPLPVAEPHDEVLDIQAAVDHTGTTTVLFGQRAEPDATYAMVAATHPTGGLWSSQILTVPDDSVPLQEIEVAAAADGALTVVWQSGEPVTPARPIPCGACRQRTGRSGTSSGRPATSRPTTPALTATMR